VSGSGRRPRPRAQLAPALAVLVSCLGLVARPAVAAPGDLDPSFSGDGKVERGSNNGWMLEEPDFSDLTVQATGRIVTAGDSGLVRFNSDGTLDNSFPIEVEPPSLGVVTVQDDGRLLAAGHTSHSYAEEKEDFLVVRDGPNGAPDATFAGDGTATTDYAGHEDQAKALAVQPDGKVVAAGYSVGLDSGDVSSRDFALARYNVDGTLDPTFSGDGMRTTNFGGDDVAHDVVLEPDGKILVAGESRGDFALARYGPGGRLDHTFSGDGRLSVRFGDRRGTGARALVLRGSGEIFAAGEGSDAFALVGIDPDGTLDSGFGRNGVVTTPFTARDGRTSGGAASDLALIDHRLLAAGRASGDFALARYRLGGRLDANFSGDGKLRTDFGPFQGDAAAAIALQQDGKVLVGGTSTWYSLDQPYGDGAIARYLMSEGPPDADADGVRDRGDLCRDVFAPKADDGCPRIEQSISLEVGTDEYTGYIDSATRCINGARVTVYRIRRHRRTVVGRDRASWGYGDYYDYEVKAPNRPGRYYSIVKRRLRPSVGWCQAARSETVNVPR
jgi:uncharacterized delta-60 repeat protein